MALTREQFQKARSAGFSVEDIIGFENERTEKPRKLNVLGRTAQRSMEATQGGTQALAQERPNMLKALGKELAYNPLTNKDLSIPKRILQQSLKLPTAGLKALGAAGQTIESGLSSPIVSLQRGHHPLSKEFQDTRVKALTGEEPVEYGDIFRQAGLPEPVAKVGGLGIAMLEPGAQEFMKPISAARKGFTKGLTKFESKLGKGIQRTHLRMLGISDEAADVFAKDPKAILRLGTSEKVIENSLDESIDNIGKGLRHAHKSVSDMFSNIVKVQGDKTMPAIKVIKGVSEPVTKSVKLNMIDSAVAEVGKSGKLVPNNIMGAKELIKLVNDVDVAVLSKKFGGKGNLSLRKLRLFDAQLDSLIDQVPGSRVHAVASKLSSDLSDMYQFLPEGAAGDMLAARASWKNLRLLEKGDPEQGIVGVEKTFRPNVRGKTPADSILKADDRLKGSLQALDDLLPDKFKFYRKLIEDAAAKEFTRSLPVKGTSLIGAAAMMFNPAMLPYVLAAGAIASPRAAGATYTMFRKTGEKIGKMLSNPRIAALTKLIERTADTAVYTAPRKIPDGEQQ